MSILLTLTDGTVVAADNPRIFRFEQTWVGVWSRTQRPAVAFQRLGDTVTPGDTVFPITSLNIHRQISATIKDFAVTRCHGVTGRWQEYLANTSTLPQSKYFQVMGREGGVTS